MAIQTEFVNLPVGDGTSMRAYVARPEGTPRAGIIVFQEIFGINEHVRDVTERFAREGYLAVARSCSIAPVPGLKAATPKWGPAAPTRKPLPTKA